MVQTLIKNWFNVKGIGVRQALDFALMVCIFSVITLATGFSILDVTIMGDIYELYILMLTLFLFDIVYHIGAYYARDKSSTAASKTTTDYNQSSVKPGSSTSSG